MNNDLISRSALKNKFDDYIKDNPTISGIFELGKIIIDNAPTVELSTGRMANVVIIPTKRPQGEWLHPYKSDIACECSNCHIQMPITDYFNFCPNCGTQMKGGAENE